MLEDLCRHALSIGSDAIEVEHRDGCEWVSGRKGNAVVSFARFKSLSADAKELRENLSRAHKKPLRTALDGKVYILEIQIRDCFGDDAFTVKIGPAPKIDPTSAPQFTKTQGQYLAFLYYYTKIHGLPPAESDLQGYFRVSAPSVHEMIKTLERNGLIEREPGRARSIRLLVRPEYLPQLK